MPTITREQLMVVARYFAQEEGTVLLLSGGDYAAGQHSYLALFPKTVVEVKADDCEDPWHFLENSVNEGIWFGYLSYEMGFWSLPKWSIPLNNLENPLAVFIQHRFVLKVNHSTGCCSVLVDERTSAEKELIERLFKSPKYHEKPFAKNLTIHTPLLSPERYHQMVQKALEWIKNGDVYQVNLSHALVLTGEVDGFALYSRLMDLNPQPFSAYINVKARTILSLSPERFLKVAEGWIESRPIKGTAPRGKDKNEDRQNKNYLIHSEKESAELLMITDLMRNDIGRVSLAGSVNVPQMRTCEAFKNVFHMHSIVRGQQHPDISLWGVLRACFPAGSITGCPKMKAMELISDLERTPRGIYTGAIGFVKDGRECDFNVAIRTMDIKNNTLKLQLGGGITADSNSANEYFETLYKGKTFFKVLNINPTNM